MPTLVMRRRSATRWRLAPPIRLRSAPPLEPPFDDEVAPPDLGDPGAEQLALDWRPGSTWSPSSGGLAQPAGIARPGAGAGSGRVGVGDAGERARATAPAEGCVRRRRWRRRRGGRGEPERSAAVGSPAGASPVRRPSPARRPTLRRHVPGVLNGFRPPGTCGRWPARRKPSTIAEQLTLARARVADLPLRRADGKRGHHRRPRVRRGPDRGTAEARVVRAVAVWTAAPARRAGAAACLRAPHRRGGGRRRGCGPPRRTWAIAFRLGADGEGAWLCTPPGAAEGRHRPAESRRSISRDGSACAGLHGPAHRPPRGERRPSTQPGRAQPVSRRLRRPPGAPWQRLYFLPEPQGQGALRDGPPPTAWPGARGARRWRPARRASHRRAPTPIAERGAARLPSRPPPAPASPSMVGAEYCSALRRRGRRPGPWPGSPRASRTAAAARPRSGRRSTGGASSTWTSRLNRKPTASSLMPSSIWCEHVEALALVLDQRVALGVRPQADALLEVVHLVEVLAPLAVDHREQHLPLQLAQRLGAELLLAPVVRGVRVVA